jgi:hypothetical protein
MWCIGRVTEEYRERMYDVLRLYAKPYNPAEPVVWLNMAEIEIGILDRQCTSRRIGDEKRLRSEMLAWEQRRNQTRCRIDWKFTRQDADQKLSRHFVT